MNRPEKILVVSRQTELECDCSPDNMIEQIKNAIPNNAINPIVELETEYVYYGEKWTNLVINWQEEVPNLEYDKELNHYNRWLAKQENKKDKKK